MLNGWAVSTFRQTNTAVRETAVYEDIQHDQGLYLTHICSDYFVLCADIIDTVDVTILINLNTS